MRYRFRFIIDDEAIAEFETDANPPGIGDEVVIGPKLIAADKAALSHNTFVVDNVLHLFNEPASTLVEIMLEVLD
ncbi:MAG: hypothetical protein K8S20_08415 [Chloroflexi bacterium]|nr:hypothetical protein [Chloroflexota bacterium]